MKEAFDAASAVLIPAQLILAMFAMGVELTPKDFAELPRRPKALSLGLVVQWLLAPLLAFAAMSACGLSSGFVIGLALIAASPGGAFSNVLTFLGKGNIALSIALTVVCTVLAPLTIPIVLGRLIGAEILQGFSFPAGRILLDLSYALLLPLALGMLARKQFGQRTRRWGMWSLRLSVVLIGVLTVGALASKRVDIGAYGWGPPLVLVGFAVSLAVVGALMGGLSARKPEEAIAVGIEAVLWNGGIGLLVAHQMTALDGYGETLFMVLAYSGVGAWFALPLLIWGRLRARRAASRESAGPLSVAKPQPPSSC